jgi:hypothetical protein
MQPREERRGAAALAADFWYTHAPHTDVNPEERGESTVTIWLTWRYRRLKHTVSYSRTSQTAVTAIANWFRRGNYSRPPAGSGTCR